MNKESLVLALLAVFLLFIAACTTTETTIGDPPTSPPSPTEFQPAAQVELPPPGLPIPETGTSPQDLVGKATPVAADWCNFALPANSHCTPGDGIPQFTNLEGKFKLNNQNNAPSVVVSGTDANLNVEIRKPVDAQHKQYPMFKTGYVYKKNTNGAFNWEEFTFDFEADVLPITEPFDIAVGEELLWYDIKGDVDSVAATADIPLSVNDVSDQNNFIATFICRCETQLDCLRPGNPNNPADTGKWECNPGTTGNKGTLNGRWVMREFKVLSQPANEPTGEPTAAPPTGSALCRVAIPAHITSITDDLASKVCLGGLTDLEKEQNPDLGIIGPPILGNANSFPIIAPWNKYNDDIIANVVNNELKCEVPCSNAFATEIKTCHDFSTLGAPDSFRITAVSTCAQEGGSRFPIGAAPNILNLDEEIASNVGRGLTENDWDILADGAFTVRGIPITYTQTLRFHPASTQLDETGKVLFKESDSDVLALHLYYKNGLPIADYEVDFTPALQSNIDAATNELSDITRKDLVLFNKLYEIIDADYTTATGVTLTLKNGADTLVLQDMNLADDVSDSLLKVNNVEIQGAAVKIKGTAATSVSIDEIWVLMTTEDEFYAPVTGVLSGAIDTAREKSEVLFTNNWDIEFRGISNDPRTTIELKPTPDNLLYELTYTDNTNDVQTVTIDPGLAAANDAAFTTEYGATINIVSVDATTVTIDIKDANTEIIAGFNIIAGATIDLGPFNTYRGATLSTPDGETESNLGYSTYGAYIDWQSAAGPDTVTITYPEQQTEALVNLVS